MKKLLKLTSRHTDQTNLFSYLFILIAFFIFLEISVFIQGSEIYLGDYKLIASHLKIPANVIPGIIYFIFIQLSLHVIYVFLIGWMAILSARILNLSPSRAEWLGIFLWFCGILLILVANQYLFPNSKFSHLTKNFVWPKFEIIYLIILSFPILSCLILASVNLFLQWPKRIILFIAFLILLSGIYSQWEKANIVDASSEEKPNIIIIGIDSLRPDFLGYFGYEKQTPYLDHFLGQSTVFTDAMTPLARTFPAWVSILSGEYPKHSRVRFNLPTLEKRNWDKTLPSMLRKIGYETIFSTDETRFSNIDQSYGFDKTLTPPIGFNDFLLGNLNDFPFSNLLVNTSLGKYLFPNSYANRPVFLTYNPNTFLDLIQPELMKPRTKPLFLAIHFCLPHFPYFWGKQNADDLSIRNYQASIKRVDQQFNDFLRLLKTSHLLNHAIVVLLSDHGEAIELPGDRVTEKELFISGHKSSQTVPHFYPKAFDFETVNQSAGHGTDVLGLTQYHIVFAFRTFGMASINKVHDVTAQVSLLDIKPTVMDFVHIRSDSSNDGVSLRPYIINNKHSFGLPLRHFFYESDFSPQAVRSVHPETRKLLFEGIEYFQMNQTGRISVKKSMEPLILSSKQFADLYGNWILALYPQNKTSRIPILVNLSTGQWTNDLNTPFAKHSPARAMLQSLRKFYGADIS